MATSTGHTVQYLALDAIHSVTWFGHTILTTVTQNFDAVTEWINAVNADGNTLLRRVGFEVEFHNHSSRIGIVQFCVGNRCLIFQPLDGESLPPALDQFLGAPRNVILGTHVLYKLNLLREQFRFVSGVHFLDLGEVAPPLRDVKLRIFASMALGMVEGDWARPSILSPNQVSYASLDAFLNLSITRSLSIRIDPSRS